MSSARVTRRRLRDLRGDDDVLRWESAKKLTLRGGWRLRVALEAIARSDGSTDARAAAAWTLGFRSDRRAAPTLAAILADDQGDPSVRAHAAEALGHLLSCQSSRFDVESAVLMGLDDPNAEVRFWSVFAAATIPVTAATARLRELATNDHTRAKGSWEISTEARWALRVLAGDPDANDALPTGQASA